MIKKLRYEPYAPKWEQKKKVISAVPCKFNWRKEKKKKRVTGG
jgi:hypothetical protein